MIGSEAVEWAHRVSLSSSRGCSRGGWVFERIVAGFFDADAGEFGTGKALEDAVHFYRKVFRGRDKSAEDVERIEVHEVKTVEQICLCECIELAEVADHAGDVVDGSGESDFDDVVMAVAVWVVAFAVGGAILVGGEGVGVQAVGGAEAVAAGEVGLRLRGGGSGHAVSP